MIQVISQIKAKVVEIATGNRRQEEWLVLPENWSHEEYTMVFDHQVYFSKKNFVAIEIHQHDVMLLILNLATRKRYWIEIASLEQKIYAKITGVDRHGVPIDPGLFDSESEIRQMKVRPDKIEINYYITTDYPENDIDGHMAFIYIGQS